MRYLFHPDVPQMSQMGWPCSIHRTKNESKRKTAYRTPFDTKLLSCWPTEASIYIYIYHYISFIVHSTIGFYRQWDKKPARNLLLRIFHVELVQKSTQLRPFSGGYVNSLKGVGCPDIYIRRSRSREPWARHACSAHNTDWWRTAEIGAMYQLRQLK